MSETENTQTPPPAAAEQGNKRSASYPVLTVMDAYNFTLKINEKFGNVAVTRKEIAVTLNLHQGSISRSLAACAAFGFLDKIFVKGGEDFKYEVTKLFRDVFMPENEKEKKICLLTAFGKPKLYQELITKFDASLIPEQLPNTLIKHHGITEAASKEVAELFIKSGMEVGAINDSRVMNYKVMLSSISKTQYAEIIEETPADTTNNTAAGNQQVVRIEPVNYNNSNEVKVPIHLTKNKMAYLAYPNDISDKDIKLLEHAINGILLRLELEKEETKKE